MPSPEPKSLDYIGDELEVFRLATNWKSYLRQTLEPYIQGEVAEVGAGLGATCEALIGCQGVTQWLCIEPDAEMAAQISAINFADRAVQPEIMAGTLQDLPDRRSFDTIIYIDVLEHIEADKAELELAWSRLKSGGRIVVLAPAFQALYSPFDKAIGHFRRYKKSSLRNIAPKDAREVTAFYRDGVGFLASLANRMLLQQNMPTVRQIRLWDGIMVRISRVTDHLTFPFFGRSVIIVWEKP